MSASRHSPTESGFSLIEVLIAITLLAFITLGVVNITQDAIQNKERTTEFNNNNLLVESALSRFEWDLTQIYSPLYFTSAMNVNQNLAGVGGAPTTDENGNPIDPSTQPPVKPPNPVLQAYYEQILSRFERNERFVTVSKDGQPIPRFHSPEKTTFEFFTSSNRRKTENTPQSHFAWVRYSLADQEVKADEKVHPEMPSSVKSLVRYFTADDPYDDKRIDADGNGTVKAAVLLKNVESLEFLFWDYKKRKWENNLRVIQDGESVIRGVMMKLTWWDSGGKRSIERTFRPHWPMVVPVDAAKKPATTTTTTTEGSEEDEPEP